MLIAINDPHWDNVIKITDIDPGSCTCITHDNLGKQMKVQVPEVLFNAILNFAVKKAEHAFLRYGFEMQDIERNEWDPKRPD